MAEKNCKLCFHYDVCYAVGRMTERAETCSKYAPDVVEVKHGEWEPIDGDNYFYCSECGREVSVNIYDNPSVIKFYPYCHCGAKMDGNGWREIK